MSGRDFLLRYFNGKLYSDCFTAQVADFAEHHYDDFPSDFKRLLCLGLRSDCSVEDSRENYEIMATALDNRWQRYITRALGTT